MSGVLIYSETTHLALELASGAQVLGGKIFAVTVNNDDQATLLASKGLDAYAVNHSAVALGDTAAIAAVLKQAAEQLNVDSILLASNRRGKELAGRLAQDWEAGCLTDVKEFVTSENNPGFRRNVLGGATIATQCINAEHKVIAVLPKSFVRYESDVKGQVTALEVSVSEPTVKFLEQKSRAGDAADIQGANQLVIVGMGVEDQADMPKIINIATALQAEVACSKPVATDRKWFSEDRIVGLSGKLCKPELAVIFGVSGQVQFVVGVREAKVVVSINNDENAYLNSISDYVLVADAHSILQELADALK